MKYVLMPWVTSNQLEQVQRTSWRAVLLVSEGPIPAEDTKALPPQFVLHCTRWRMASTQLNTRAVWKQKVTSEPKRTRWTGASGNRGPTSMRACLWFPDPTSQAQLNWVRKLGRAERGRVSCQHRSRRWARGRRRHVNTKGTQEGWRTALAKELAGQRQRQRLLPAKLTPGPFESRRAAGLTSVQDLALALLLWLAAWLFTAGPAHT